IPCVRVKSVHCRLHDSGQRKRYWAEALVAVADVRNTIPREGMDKSTFELTFKKPAPTAARFKLDDTGRKFVLLGYRKGQRLLDMATGRIISSRSVTFDEGAHQKQVRTVATLTWCLTSDRIVSAGGDRTNSQQRGDGVSYPLGHEVTTDGPSTPRASGTPMSSTPGRDGEDESRVWPVRKKCCVVRYEQEFQQPIQMDDFEADYPTLVVEVDDESAVTYVQIMQPEHRAEWQQAIESEMQSLREHNTWRLAPLSHDRTPNWGDTCVYVNRGSGFTIIVVYVDDLIVMALDRARVDDGTSGLKQDFRIKELGSLHYWLGIEVHRDRQRGTLAFSQRGYIDKIDTIPVDKIDTIPVLQDANPHTRQQTPIPTSPPPTQPSPRARTLTESLWVASSCTRPDIAHAVEEVAKHCEANHDSHWVAAKSILKYLVTMRDAALRYTSSRNALSWARGCELGVLLGRAAFDYWVLRLCG
ncbi:TPA: hypothetical protein N0F65_007770, partial [Lagenidium giganteum]